ncbi:MAG: hypothetical protein L0I62_09555 [Gammaproteobacteria bacterium]|nr:hypothetical protein [Gammaproteobacteria bacterium]
MFDRIGRLAPAAGIIALAAALAACNGNPSPGGGIDAGPDQVVTGRSSVTLSAVAGTILQGFSSGNREFHWRFASTPARSALTNADIQGADSAVARFTPDVAGVYVVQLTARTEQGAVEDTVEVTSRPTVEAGPDRTVYGNEPITLQARSNVADPSYTWSFAARPEGSSATLDGAASATAGFTPDVPGVYRVQVGLADGAASDTVAIRAEHVWQPGVLPEASTRITGAAAQMGKATSLALAPDGTLYIAFRDEREDARAVVKRLDGEKWTKLGDEPVSTSHARFTSLAVSPQGNPVVAFQDFGAQARGGITVRRFAEGKWTTLGEPGFSVGEAEYVSLAIAPDGTLWVAYQDFSNEGAGGATVQKFDGETWQTVGRAGFSEDKARYISLAIAPDGTPWVGFQDFADHRHGASVYTFDGKRWYAPGGAGLSPDTAAFVSLAIAPDGTPWIMFEDNGHEFPGSVEKFDGDHWTYVGKSWMTRGAAEFDTIAIAPDGTPYVAYQDELNEGISVQKFDGKGWEYVGQPGFSRGEAEGVALAIAGDGTLYVSWVGEAGGEGAEADEDGEEKEAVSVRRFDGKRWVSAGGTVDAWDENAEREDEH